jgi:SAM-dependent methyltransferase
MKGYVKTPQWVVDLMISKLFSDTPPTKEKSLLDPGCGPGDFIEGVVRWCDANHKQVPKITGVEIDPKHAMKAVEKFRDYPKITIEQRDFLLPIKTSYDYVICNPPYVPITALSEDEKTKYKPLFESATGRFDLYLLFFEQALKILRKDGRLVFITPEKFTYVKTAAPIRKIIASKQLIEIEYLKENAFGTLTTYPLISTIVNKAEPVETRVILRDGRRVDIILPVDGASWLPYINQSQTKSGELKLGDICSRISCGVATGADSVFIKRIDEIAPFKQFAYPTISGKELDTSETAIKSSFMMLIPYSPNGKLIEFEELDNFAKYLSQPYNRIRLEKRTCATRKPWYAFHETPPLNDILKPKILCKDISSYPHFWIDREGSIVPRHSVYYIVPKEPSQIEAILEYLETKEAKDWLKANCQNASNGFIRLQSSILKELPIPEKLYLK